MPGLPKFKITLEPRKSHHMLETKPRYDVMVNGVRREELYFNMRGYVGYLPMLNGGRLALGESSISTFRREVANLNREAAQLLDAIARDPDPHVIHNVCETTDRDTLIAETGRRRDDGSTMGTCCIARREWEYARILFGTEMIPAKFFEEVPFAPACQDDPGPVEFDAQDRVLAAIPTDDHAFVLLAIGKPDATMARLPLGALPQEAVAAEASQFVWLTRMAWKELTALAGRALVNARDIPLAEGRTLAPSNQPQPKPGPGQEWIRKFFPEPSEPCSLAM